MVVQLSLRAPKKMLKIGYDRKVFSTLPSLATKKCVPVKENARVNILVLWKRGKLLKMLLKFTTMPSKRRTRKNLWEEARQNLFASFDSLREDEVLSNVQRTEA